MAEKTPKTSRSSKSTKSARKHDAEVPSPIFDITPAPVDVEEPPVPVHSGIPLQKPTVLELPPDPEKRGTGGLIHEFRKKSEKSRALRMTGMIAGAAATAAAVTGIIVAGVVNAERRQRQRKKKKKK